MVEKVIWKRNKTSIVKN